MTERVSLGHLFMIAAGLLAFVLTVALLQDRSTTATVLVANTEILPGAAVTNDMVSEVDLPATSDLVNSIVAPDLFTPGMIAAQRVAAGDPLTKTALAPLNSTSGMRAMSLPIDRINAVGGDLTPGDRVDIIGVDGATARYVAVDLEVLATQSDPSATGALASAALSNYYVTVALDDQTALALALALETGEVSVLRSTGSPVVPVDRRQLDFQSARSNAAAETSPEPAPETASDSEPEGGNSDG